MICKHKSCTNEAVAKHDEMGSLCSAHYEQELTMDALANKRIIEALENAEVI